VLPNLAHFQLDEHIVRTETMFHMPPPTASPSMPSLPPPLTPPPREDDVLFNLAGLDVTMLHVYIVTGSALLAACVLLSVARAVCALRSMCRRGRAAERPMVTDNVAIAWAPKRWRRCWFLGPLVPWRHL